MSALNKTVKQHLEHTYILQDDFFKMVGVPAHTLWQDVSIGQLSNISRALGDSPQYIIVNG